MAKRKTPAICIVSDGRGETCDLVVRAALVQFEGTKYRVTRKSNVRTAAVVRQIVEKAADSEAIVFYTLVGEDTRAAMKEAAAEHLVPAVDVLGPSFSALRDLFRRAPGHTPGLLVASDKDYFQRLDAVDYTLKHDDGQRPHELPSADVVLVGVSRASKSTTCFLLGYRGVRAANVPLIHGLEPPAGLLKVDPDRVIGLRINVMRLQTVREARAMAVGISLEDDYVDKRAIAREVRQAHDRMERQGWRSLDVSYMAVEEIAREVVRLVGLDVRI